MRLITARRLRALGLLAAEAAAFVALVSSRVSKDAGMKDALGRLLRRARAL